MALAIRDFDTMVDDILARIVSANVGITDTGRGSVVRTLVESIVAELDILGYTLDNIYNAMNIDMASDTDLDNIVAILGVVRNQATTAEGYVTFARVTPAVSDIPIPYGTVVSTRPDTSGLVYEFAVNEDVTLLTGQTSVNVAVVAIQPGHIYIPANQIIIMSDPVIGIESVYNSDAIDSGTDQETDIQLRNRAKLAMGNLGKSTSNALRSAILDVDGISDVVVIDQARGVGTADIVVVGNTIPLSQTTEDAVLAAISSTKAAGIDIDIIYPSIKSVDISVTTDIDDNITAGAIQGYVDMLTTGGTFIINQMEKAVLNAGGSISNDITTLAPAANITSTESEIIRIGTITINGVVWNG